MIKLALIGDSFCRQGQCLITDTFVSIIKKHYGAELNIVLEGRVGGSDLAARLEDIDRALELDADIIFVFHQPQNDRATALHQAEQELIYQKLRNTRALVWHWQDRQSDNLPQHRHRVDTEALNYPYDWYTEYRHCVPYTVSDNGVDQAGNNKIARKIIEIIDEYRSSMDCN